jgi:hypothetical protein
MVLLCMLLIAPPGSSVVWPFPGARHLHIGWIGPTGFVSSSLLVFSHPANRTVAADHRPSSVRPFQSAGSAVATPESSAGRLLVQPASLLWELALAAIFVGGRHPLPEEPPPRSIA